MVQLRSLIGCVVLSMMVLSAPAHADGPPKCTPEIAGGLSCQANVACRCQFYHASKAHGTKAGYRWDCGIRRPKCEVSPADAGYQGPFPEAVAIDRSTDIFSQSQSSSQSITESD